MAVTINATNFPDANFRSYVQNDIAGGASTLTDSVINGTVRIYAAYKNIASLKGIEYFTKVEELVVPYNSLTSLDVSKNTALTLLHCQGNNLTTLDVSKNTKLNGLVCDDNALTTLTLNTGLENLIAYSNNLTVLDLSKSTYMQTLHVYDNHLTKLNLSHLSATGEFFDTFQQTCYGLKISETGNSAYPYQLDFKDYVGATDTGNIDSSSVKGYESTSGNVTVGTSYANGIARFAKYPMRVEYKYKTGCVIKDGTIKTMPVTLIKDLIITTSSLPDAAKGKTYSSKVEATGTTPITWSVVSGSLPPGLTLNANTGAISGTAR